MSEKKVQLPKPEPNKNFDKKAFIKAAEKFAKILEKEKTQKRA